jgi:hypothetical protein
LAVDLAPDLAVDLAPDLAPDIGAAPPSDYCNLLPALALPPVLDGVVDGNLTLVRVPAASWLPGTLATAPATTDFADVAFAWRPNGLYFYAKITDPKVTAGGSMMYYCQDAVEIFFDTDGLFAALTRYDSPGTRQFIVSAPRASTAETRLETYVETVMTGSLSATPPREIGAFPVPDGYVVEGFVTQTLMATPVALVAGARVGFDLQVDVASKPNTGPLCREGAYFFKILPTDATGIGQPHIDTRAFCTPTLAP